MHSLLDNLQTNQLAATQVVDWTSCRLDNLWTSQLDEDKFHD